MLNSKYYCLQLALICYIYFSQENLTELNVTREMCFQSSSSGICSLFVNDVMQLRKNHASMFQLVPKEHRQ